MNKINRLLLLCLCTISCTALSAQFNTIVPHKATTEKEPSEAQNSPSSVPSSEVVQKTPFIPINKSDKDYFNMPLADSLVITSAFGYRTHPISKHRKFHRGIDLRAKNEYVYSIAPGKVIRIGNNKKLGKYVEIQHGDFKSIYGHLSSILVNKKQQIKLSQPIAISGNTGQTTGPHLHLGIKYMNKYINPAPIIEYMEQRRKINEEDL